MFYAYGKQHALAQLGLTKTAGRMEAALRAGEITANDLFPHLKRVPRSIERIRGKLTAPGADPKGIGKLRNRRALQAKNKTTRPEEVRRAIQKAEEDGVHVIEYAPEITSSIGHTPFQDIAGTLTPLEVPLTRLGNMPKKLDAPRRLYAQAMSRKPGNILPVLEHELGEASLYRAAERGEKIRPFASHWGAEPLVREMEHSLGDPVAQRLFTRMRSHHLANEEDQVMHRLMKQVGHSTHKPMALGGKQERALNKLYDKAVEKGVRLEDGTDPIRIMPRDTSTNIIPQLSKRYKKKHNIP